MVITFKFVLIALFAISTLATVTSIGEPRKPITSRTAAISVFLNFLLILGIINTF